MTSRPRLITARVFVTRGWPLLVVMALVIASAYLPSVELSRGERAARIAAEQSTAVCPIPAQGSVGTFAVATQPTARDVSLRWFGTRTGPKPVSGPLRAMSVPGKAGVAIVATGDDSATTTDAVMMSVSSKTLLRGMYAQMCVSTATHWWFAGAASDYGRGDLIVLTNPLRARAVVDIEALTAQGSTHSAASRGISVSPRSRRVLPVSALFPGLSSAVVHVATTSGQIHAAILASQFEGSTGTGAEWLPATTPGANRVPVAADLVGGSLVLAATVSTRVSVVAAGPGGEFTPVGLESIAIPAGHCVTVPLPEVAPDAAVLRIDSTAPVVAGIVGKVAKKRGRAGDLVASAGTSTSLERTQAVVGMRGASSRLIIIADAETATQVDLTIAGTWRKRLSLNPDEATAVAIPEQSAPAVVLVTATEGRFALMASHRVDGSTLRLAADVTAVARQATLLVRPVVQAER